VLGVVAVAAGGVLRARLRSRAGARSATLAANVAHGLGHGLIGAAVAAWPAVALAGSYELMMMIISGVQVPADVTAAGLSGSPDAGRLLVQGRAGVRW
jgi:hypothetical protein